MENVCPKCKGSNLEFTNCEDGGDYKTYSYTCKDCGCEAHEQFELVYMETNVDEEEQKIYVFFHS